jgi:hypothetical protein
MENYIRYQRFETRVTEDKIQEFYNELTQGGWEIIYYNEDIEVKRSNAFSSNGAIVTDRVFNLVALCGKKPNLIKNVL